MSTKVLFEDGRLEIRLLNDGDVLISNIGTQLQAADALKISPRNGSIYVTAHGSVGKAPMKLGTFHSMPAIFIE